MKKLTRFLESLSPLWPVPVAFGVVIVALLVNIGAHRNDVAYYSVVGERFCADAAECESNLVVPITLEDGEPVYDPDKTDPVPLKAMECKVLEAIPATTCARALEKVHGYPTVGGLQILGNPVGARENLRIMFGIFVVSFVASALHTRRLRQRRPAATGDVTSR